MNVENWRTPKMKEFLGICAYDGADLAKQSKSQNVSDDDLIVAAGQTLNLWAYASRVSEASTMIVKSSKRISMATRKGGLIVEGQGGLNLGLLMNDLKHIDAAERSLDLPHGHLPEDRFQQTMIKIIGRLARTQAPRVFDFVIGDENVSLYVSPDKIFLISGAQTAGDVTGYIKDACASGLPVTYSLGAIPTDITGPSIALADFLSLSEDDGSTTWTLGADDWPLNGPKDADFDQIKSVIGLSHALRIWAAADEKARVELRSPTGNILSTGELNADGTSQFSLHVR